VTTPYPDQRLHRLIEWARRPSARPGFIILVGVMILSVYWLDLATGPGREPAALYDIPIMLAAVALGTSWVLVTCSACLVTYHHTLWYHHLTYSTADVSQTVLFFLLGLVVAGLVSRYLLSGYLQRELLELNADLERRVAEAVTAERGAQQRLRDAQRLTLLGETAAHVAHEIKNPLVSIGGFARRLERHIEEDHPAHEGLGIIVREVARLEELLKELLEFASPECREKRPVAVPAIVAEVLALAQKPAEMQKVRLRFEAPAISPTVLGDGDRIKRALLNIVLNGIQAMPDGGEMRVALSALIEDGVSWVLISVRDQGTGILPEDFRRIFDPFFTTKSQGTGLGLAVVKKTADAHGGRVQVRSAPGEGTAFSLWLPAMPP
jgi:signal transduction histidine kinase